MICRLMCGRMIMIYGYRKGEHLVSMLDEAANRNCGKFQCLAKNCVEW